MNKKGDESLKYFISCKVYCLSVEIIQEAHRFTEKCISSAAAPHLLRLYQNTEQIKTMAKNQADKESMKNTKN